MTTSIGLVFEVATLTGVSLFEQDISRLVSNIDLVQSKIALLPKRTRIQTKAIDDDF